MKAWLLSKNDDLYAIGIGVSPLARGLQTPPLRYWI